MSFRMDTTQSINYKGGSLRFYMTIPGYGMGAKGQQEAEVLFQLAEQYVMFVNAAAENGQEYIGDDPYKLGQSMADYLKDGLSSDELDKLEEAFGYNKTENLYHITNPYYFILQDGIKMPDKVYAYVANKEVYEEYNHILANEGLNAQAKIDDLIQDHGSKISVYLVNSLWSGGSMGRVTINYNDTYRTTSFTMPIDDQVFKLRFKVDPLIFRTEGPIDAFTSTTTYGPDDIILLPTTSGVRRVVDGITYSNYLNVTYNTDGHNLLKDKDGNQVLDDEGNVVYDGNVVFDQYYSYVVHFTKPNGEEVVVTINDIDGGGTYRDNYNKWYFGAIKFGENNQYATMTLGGKGGQVIRWKFISTSTRKWINSNVPNLLADLSNTEFTLPKNLIQIFNTVGGTNIQRTAASDYIPIEYYNLRSATSDTMGKYGINIDASDYSFTMNASTYSNVQSVDFGKKVLEDKSEVQILNDNQIALLDWTVLGRRAYPSYSKKVGGTIIISGIGSTTITYITPPKTGLIDGLLTEYTSGFSEAYISDVDSNIHNLYAPNTNETSINDNTNINYVNAGQGVSPNYEYPSGRWGANSANRIIYNSNTGTTTQTVLPTIKVLQGSKFELHNLPILGMNYIYGKERNPRLLGATTYSRGNDITGMYLPWYKADVYEIISQDFGIVNGEFYGTKRKLSDGDNDFMFIDTCASDGTNYLLTCNFELQLITEDDPEILRKSADNGTGGSLARRNALFTIHIIITIVESF